MLYTAQLGWLNSTFERQVGKDTQTLSNLEFYGHDSELCELPPTENCASLISTWNKLGRYKSKIISGMGVSVIYEPLDWSELAAYSRLNKIGRWELKFIHAMSRMFCDAYSAHKNKRNPPPHIKDGWDFESLQLKAAYQKAIKSKKTKAP